MTRRCIFGRLFELDAITEAAFRGDMPEPRKRLMQMLTAAGKGLDRLDQLDQLVPVVQELGKRHVAYGVEDTTNDTVGDAL